MSSNNVTASTAETNEQGTADNGNGDRPTRFQVNPVNGITITAPTTTPQSDSQTNGEAAAVLSTTNAANNSTAGDQELLRLRPQPVTLDAEANEYDTFPERGSAIIAAHRQSR